MPLTRYTLHIQTGPAGKVGRKRKELRTPPNAHISLYNKLYPLVPVYRALRTAHMPQAAVG